MVIFEHNSYMLLSVMRHYFYYYYFVAFTYNLLLSLKTVNILFFRLYYKKNTCNLHLVI